MTMIKNYKVIENTKGPTDLTVICSVHGTEQAPLLVAALLVEALKDSKQMKYRIIAPANISGLLQNTRTVPLDGQDLNRVFSNLEGKNTSNISGKEIYNLCKNSKVVIDLHNYEELMTLPVAYYFSDDNEERVKKVCKALKHLEIPYVKEVFKEDEDEYFRNAFFATSSYKLATDNIPSFTIEMSPLFAHKVEDLQKLAKKITEIPAVLKDETQIKELIHYKKEEGMVAGAYGIFVPESNIAPGDYLKKNTKVGIFYPLADNFNPKVVRNNLSGECRSIAFQRFFKPSEPIIIIVSKYSKIYE